MSDSGGIHVLHVDDDPNFAELVADMLEREDGRFTVETATDASEGRTRLAEEDVDCIVSDFDMPGQHGIEFLEAVREEYPDLPFILFTGKGSEEVASEAISAGVTEYLQKGGGTERYELLANRISNVVSQYRAYRRAEHAQRQMRQVIDLIPEPVFAKNEDGEFILVNEAFADAYDMTPAEIAGKPETYVESSERARSFQEIDRPLLDGDESRRVYEGEFHAGDSRKFHETFKIPFDIPGSDERGVLSYVRDVTDLKERERALEELYDIATELTEYDTRDAVCERTIEAAETVLDFDLCAISIEEDGMLPAVAISEKFPPEETRTMSVDEGVLGETYRTGESSLVDDVQSRDDANSHWQYRSVISVPIGDHGVFQAVAEEPGAFEEHDLHLAELLLSHTESILTRLDREQQLQRQHDRWAEFASVVSHDLQNPLTVAQGRLELARETCDSEHLDDAANAVDRSLALIEDLLTLAREGEEVTRVDAVDLGDMSEDCWRTVETADATLRTRTERTIEADSSLLRRLLENLFRNAVEHGGSDVVVTIGDLDGGFYVADDGPGIPDDERERVLERGYSTTADGAGFGLAIVSDIADAHGWQIGVTDGEDGGARFDVTGVEIIDG